MIYTEKQKQKRNTANATGIPSLVKEQYETMSGLSFDDVRVHYNSGSPAQFHALAYTRNNHIYIGPGQEKHLKHELGHVIQQKLGMVRPTGYLNGVAVNDNPRLERAADALDRNVIQRYLI